MKRKPITASAVGFVLVLFLGIVFALAHGPARTISVRHLNSVQSGKLTTATFAITNHTSNRYFVLPRSVEAHGRAKWKTCFEFTDVIETELSPTGHATLMLEMANLPSGTPLRLSLILIKELRGPKGFFGRLRLILVDKVNDVPLNPFDMNSAIGSHPISIKSDEFVEPEPK